MAVALFCLFRGYGCMVMARLLLKLLIWAIYALFATIVLYFPMIELVGYFARETRLLKIPQVLPIEDALLPLLCLAIMYAVITKILQKTAKPEAPPIGRTHPG
jgi:hypothetical protein